MIFNDNLISLFIYADMDRLALVFCKASKMNCGDGELLGRRVKLKLIEHSRIFTF